MKYIKPGVIMTFIIPRSPLWEIQSHIIVFIQFYKQNSLFHL